jgi:predicted RNA-binding Zn ribbon-like protein
MQLCSLELPALRSTNANLARAKKLRAVIWRIAQAVLSDARPRVADVRRLNAEAKRPSLVRVLSGDGTSTHWHHPTVAAAFATIAQDAVSLFGDATQRVRLRRCENSSCRVVFYDDSRPGLRRWCAPNRCGDRIRARAYRQRALAASRRKSTRPGQFVADGGTSAVR